MKKIVAILCIVLNCITGCVSAPTDRLIDSLKASDGYLHIRTRIAIAEKDGYPVRDMEEIQKELKACEDLFSDVKIKFDVILVECIEDNKDFMHYRDDAEKHYDTLSIYYVYIQSQMRKGKERVIYGLSNMAWQKENAIIIARQCNDKWVLAHEMGHWGGGLGHVFDPDDEIEDTPPPIYKDVADLSMNENIMNYANEFNCKTITSGQLERFKINFLTYRLSYIIK